MLARRISRCGRCDPGVFGVATPLPEDAPPRNPHAAAFLNGCGARCALMCSRDEWRHLATIRHLCLSLGAHSFKKPRSRIIQHRYRPQSQAIPHSATDSNSKTAPFISAALRKRVVQHTAGDGEHDNINTVIVNSRGRCRGRVQHAAHKT